MNKKGHVLNALLLGVGLTAVTRPVADWQTVVLSVEITVPVVLGALFPDVDTAFGKHRKTLHNLPVLALFYAFPAVFGNLAYVWIGVLTHYVLDVVGSRRGIALFYPFSKEYSLPTGVAVSSKWAGAVTVVITGIELVLVALVVHYRLPVQDVQAVLGALL